MDFRDFRMGFIDFRPDFRDFTSDFMDHMIFWEYRNYREYRDFRYFKAGFRRFPVGFQEICKLDFRSSLPLGLGYLR